MKRRPIRLTAAQADQISAECHRARNVLNSQIVDAIYRHKFVLEADDEEGGLHEYSAAEDFATDVLYSVEWIERMSAIAQSRRWPHSRKHLKELLAKCQRNAKRAAAEIEACEMGEPMPPPTLSFADFPPPHSTIH